MEDGSDVVSDAVAIKVVALIPVVDGNKQIDANAEMPVIDDRVDVEETAVVEDIDVASTSLSKKTKHAVYMANQRSTESDEKRESRLADDRARKAKSRQAQREQTTPGPKKQSSSVKVEGQENEVMNILSIPTHSLSDMTGTEPEMRQVRLDADAARKRLARAEGSSTKRKEVTTELATTKTNTESATILQDKKSADRKRKRTLEEEPEQTSSSGCRCC